MRKIFSNNREGLIYSIYLLQKTKTSVKKSYIYYKHCSLSLSPSPPANCICLNNFWNCYNPTSVQDTELDDSEDELQ